MSDKTRTRPATTVERDQVIRASREIEMRPLSPVLQAVLTHEFIEARAAYEAALTTYSAAKMTEIRTGQVASQAKEDLEVAVRGYVGTVRDEKNRAIPGEVSALFGGLLPSELADKADVEQVAITKNLVAQLAENPRLLGADKDRGEMLAARDALAAAVDARTKAVNARAKAYTALGLAEKDFDFGWGDMVRVIEKKAPDLVTEIPLFEARETDADEQAKAEEKAKAEKAKAEAKAEEAKAEEAKAAEEGKAEAEPEADAAK